MPNQTMAQQMESRILRVVRPEDLFGSLDGSDRPELVGKTIPIRFANLAMRMDEICKILPQPSLDVSHKLLNLFRMSVFKIRRNAYATIAPSWGHSLDD